VKCLQRNIVTEDDMTMFMIYWEEILPKMTPKDHWKNQRYFSTITSALHPDFLNIDPKRQLVTPEDEATVAIIIHNASERWQQEFEHPPPKKKDRKAEDSKHNKNGIFSSSDKGQNKWGGWSAEGLQQYNEYLQMVKEGRAASHAEKVERNCLMKLRAKYNVTATNKMDQDKMDESKRRREKAGKPVEIAAPMNTIVKTINFTLDSDPDYDDDSDEE